MMDTSSMANQEIASPDLKRQKDIENRIAGGRKGKSKEYRGGTQEKT